MTGVGGGSGGVEGSAVDVGGGECADGAAAGHAEASVGNKNGEGDVDNGSGASAKNCAEEPSPKRQRTGALLPAVAAGKESKLSSTLLGKEVMLLFF